MNIFIPEKLQDEIIHYSSGLSSICHELCYFMCDAAFVKQTVSQPVEFDYTDLKDALKRYIKSVEDTIKKSFDKAMKISSVEYTLRIISHQNKDGNQIGALLEWASEYNVKINENKLKSDLAKLETEDFGELIKFDENSLKYSFANPFYGTFTLAFFEGQEKKMRSAKKKSQKDIMELLNNAFKTFTSNVAPEDGG